MELITRVVLLAVIFIAILLVVYFMMSAISPAGSVTKAQALNRTLAYVKNTYPGAITSVNVTASPAYAGSWLIIVGIITNATSPCPSYSVDTFDYPRFPFINRTQNIYTSGCAIKGFSSGKNFSLYNAPEAITLAYLNASVNGFVSQFGFGNVSVMSQFYNGTVRLQGTNYTNIYLLNYSAPMADYNLYAVLSQSTGNVLRTYGLAK